MNDEEMKREKRRRRRIRSQFLAYFTLAVLVVMALAALYFGVSGAIRYVKSYNNKVNEKIAEAESGMATESEEETEPVAESTQPAYDEIDYAAEPSDDPLGELVDTLLRDMTIEEMVAGMFLVTPEALTGVQNVVRAGDSTKDAITEKPVGGIIYSAKNFKSQEQFREMLQNTTEFSEYPLFLAVTAECGTNSGFGLEDTKKASEITDADGAKEAYGIIAETLSSYGINMNMAPMSETFGSDAAAAAPLVNASVQAMQEKGVSAVLQKFSGVDTEAFILYETAIQNGVSCIMVSDISASDTTIADVLRGELGFDGVVITDALDDSAITQNQTPADAAVAAIEAGADVLYRPSDFDAAYEGVMQAIADGRITKERIYESLVRIYRVKYRDTVLD